MCNWNANFKKLPYTNELTRISKMGMSKAAEKLVSPWRRIEADRRATPSRDRVSGCRLKATVFANTFACLWQDLDRLLTLKSLLVIKPADVSVVTG
jgi:hypothetical protein